ncbi:MAG TPA: IS1634 family transposase [Clostridiales bacterium]|nr:IS1634 family transposase [Clostridiales bacterium]
MFLRKSFNKKSGRTYLTIVHGYRDQFGKSKSKTVKSIGYLDELEKEYSDPIKHFTQVAKEMDKERTDNEYLTLQIHSNEKIQKGTGNRKNYGHIVFSKIYHELELNRFFNNKRRHENFKYNTDSIMRLLLFCRLLYPASKKKTLELKDWFFDNFNFSLDDVYNSLSHFHETSTDLLRHLHDKIVEQYDRETSLVYYDVTNYYFEIDKEDELRKKGFSKEGRRSPIVQMGLALDRSGIPITYKLFKGNTHDSETYLPAMSDIKKEYGVDRIIVVADKGLNSGDNIAFNTVLGDGYIFSKSIRGADEEFKAYVLDEKGYIEGNDYKMKSRVIPAEINVTVKQVGKKKSKKKVQVDQKQVIFYSEKYAQRSKRKREELLAKAADLIANPAKYNKATSYGAAGYVKNLDFDKETCEIKETSQLRFIDTERIQEEEKYDGYYAIVTSELDELDSNIINAYRGLWKIEESFKITKSTLGARPVYLSRDDHINAHFLICFLALTIARLTEIRLKNRYPFSRIVESLRSVSCTHIDQNLFVFDYDDEITVDLNNVFNFNFGKKFMTLAQIKKNLASSKKG